MSKLKKILSLVLTLAMVMTMGTVSFAQDTEADKNRFDSINEIENYIQSELTAFINEENLSISLGEISCTLDFSKIDDLNNIENLVDEKLDIVKTDLKSSNAEIDNKIMTRGISTSGDVYVAKVESLVPAIGWGYICQDFSASVTNSKINSVSLIGSSYDTGFTLGTWEHNYSWYDISSNKGYVQVRMKGTISYLWDLINISAPCTFKATGKASGSSIVSTTYHEWPD